MPLGFDDDALRFIWQTDSHVNTNGLNGARALAVEAAIADVNTWRPNAYIHTGDHGDNHGYHVREALRIERQSQRPTFFVIGNHDELDDNAGGTNVAELEGTDFFRQSAPFDKSMTMISGDGTLKALCIMLDSNYYDDDPDGGAPGDSPILEPGDRIGQGGTYPIGGGSFHRMFTTAQLAWLAATLAADTTSQMVLVFSHYPPAGVTQTNYAAVADALQADGRPAIGFCGHVHPDATSYTLTSTDTLASYTWYKMPATQESGCWTRVTLSLDAGAITIDGMEIHNFTNPGGAWVINAPFTEA